MSHHVTPPIPPSHLGSAPATRKDAYALQILIAASIVGTWTLTTTAVFSANDGSRWATIRALVDTGTYSIGYRVERADGTYDDFGIVAEEGWRTYDVVMNPVTRRFYSTKPTLLPTLLAGEYWILRQVTNLDLGRNRPEVAKILITINLVPFLLYLVMLAHLCERLGATDWGRLFVFATACFGTFVFGFQGTLNNHTVAATGALFAVYQALRIHLDERRDWWRFVLAGLFAGWTVCNELPALTLALGLHLWLFRLSPRDTVRLVLPATLFPIAAYLVTQYLAFGSVIPTYAQATWYEFAGSYWLAPQGIDLADEPKLLYATNLLVGHTGILSLTPVLLIGWIGMVRTAARVSGSAKEDSAARILAWLTTALTTITFVFYVFRTENYGGVTTGPRWFFWLVPLWLLTMLPEADRWGVARRRRALASVLLAVSIGSATYALLRPWRHSWLFTILRYWGVISY